ENDARKEARFCDSQNDARGIERPDASDEHHPDRGDSPADENAGNPAACAHTLQNQIAGDLEQAIADEEQPGAIAVLGVAESKISLQFRGGKADVHPIDIRDDVTDE